MEASNNDLIANQDFYNDVFNEVDTNLAKIEERPELRKSFFNELNVRTNTIEISLTILKNGEKVTKNKTVHQHQWSWLKFACSCIIAPFGPMIYTLVHYHYSDYSRESTINLIKNMLIELSKDEDIIDSKLLNCSIRVNLAVPTFVPAGGYWTLWKDLSEEIFSYKLLKV